MLSSFKSKFFVLTVVEVVVVVKSCNPPIRTEQRD